MNGSAWSWLLVLPAALLVAAALIHLRTRRLIGLPCTAMDRWRRASPIGKLLVCILAVQLAYTGATKLLRNPPPQSPPSPIAVVQPDAGDLDAGFEVTNLCFTAIERGTNSTALLLAWPPEDRPPLDRVGLFAAREFPGSWSHLLDVDISACASNALVEVMDSEMPTNSPSTAFFRLGDPAPPDADGDGFSDAEEIGEITVRNEFEWHDTTGFTTVYGEPPPTYWFGEDLLGLTIGLPGSSVVQGIALTGLSAFENGFVGFRTTGDWNVGVVPYMPYSLSYRAFLPASIMVAPYWGLGRVQYGNASSYMRAGTLADGTAVVEFHDVKRDRWSAEGMTHQVIVPGGTGEVVRVSYLSSDIPLDGSNVVVGVQNARRTLPGGMVYGLEWDFAGMGPIVPPVTVEYRIGTGTDPDSADSDNDGLNDWTELYETGTDPWDPDTDNDNLPDGDEIALGTNPHSSDTDGDGLPDVWEVAHSLDPLSDVEDDGASGDPDEDSLTNAQERQLGTDPQDPDTDNDGLDDNVEIELETDPLNEDTDGDGLVDGDEIIYETNPLSKDTDGDCLWDGWEVSSGMDPTVDNAVDENNQNDLSADPDEDGLNNWQEFVHGSHPYNAHTFNVTVSDRVYVQNGMSATSPTNGVVLRISVGDSSLSNSERWGIVFTDINQDGRRYTIACDAYGQVVSEDITFERGRHYRGVLTHYGSSINESDYDWTAQVDTLPTMNVLPTGGTHPETSRWISIQNKGVLIDNIDGLLGLSDDSFGSTDNSRGKAVHLYTIEQQVYDGLVKAPEGGYAYISASPEMPDLSVRLRPEGLPGTMNQRIHVEYRRAPSNQETFYPGPNADDWREEAASSTWRLRDACGKDFRGGKLSFISEYKGLSFTNVIHVRGANPAAADVESVIGTPHWYARAIAKRESGIQNGRYYCQFNLVGSLGPDWGDYRLCPSFGSPDGWGIFQIDPPTNMETLWNWKTNVLQGCEIMQECRNEAVNWINSQKAQQEAEDPSQPLSAQTFTIGGVQFREGSSRTPVDACTINRYNGVPHGWVIYWQNRTSRKPGRWRIRAASTGYVNDVLQEAGEVQ